VLLLSVRAGFKGNNEVHCYGRRIPQQVVVRALMVAVLYGTLFLAAGLCMSQLEPILLSEAIFECASAIGTVGLTLGVTTQLCTASKVMLILLMYFGRVGGLTLVYAVSGGTRRPRHSYPEESIGIG
ncbi:MAG: potassium transporter TrkG, partial [Candidatus Onthomonas sp.]|nr:potassium transporter TrkG [Candidatus Onthomonas sp.]